jgi:hypothetical protein
MLAQRRTDQSRLEHERPAGARLLEVVLLVILGGYLGGAVSEAFWLSALF